MPWWAYSILGASAVLAWQFTSERRAKRRNAEDRCVQCGQRLEITRFRFEGQTICAACAQTARQDVVWGAWMGFTLGALGIVIAIGVLIYYLIADRPMEVVWIALPAIFGLMFLWSVRSEARYLRRQNRIAERLESIERLEALPDWDAKRSPIPPGQ
jgi:hypothetical protein